MTRKPNRPSGPSRARCPECGRIVAGLAIRDRLHFTAHPTERNGSLIDADACAGSGWLVEDDERVTAQAAS